MHSKFKTTALAISLILNGLFIAVLIPAAASKSQTALLSFPPVEGGYTAAAAVITLPSSSGLVFNPVEISLKPAQKTVLQYSVFTGRKQTDILLNALYDPQIVSLEYSGSGIIITAVRTGETLLQYISNDGIKDLIRIAVTE
jgi:hypothetical protein